MKYTKGPWIAWDTGNGMGICPKSVTDDLIPNFSAFQNEVCRIQPSQAFRGDDWDKDWETCKVNAKLIAAAPELYEALQQIRMEHHRLLTQEGCDPSLNATLQKVTAAINKARGEE